MNLPQDEADLIERPARLARGRLPREQADLAEAFVRLYYAGVDPEELAARAPEDLAGAAASHLAFGRRYAGGAPKVRVYNPRSEEHGWQCGHTVVEIVNDDMPFLVDSVAMEANRQGLTVHLVIHPVLRATRDAQGALVAAAAPGAGAGGRHESFMHLELDRQTDPGRLKSLQDGIVRVLADVRAAVEDWKPMQERLRAVIAELASAPPPLPRDEVDEARAFLEWLLEHHFTLIGCRDYDLVVREQEDALRIVSGSGLGILRERAGTTVSSSFATLPPETRARARVPELLVLSKANSRSTVHRPGYLDYVGVKRIDAHGQVTGERRFLGLYTHTAYSQSPAEIPVLRRKIARVVERAGLLPSGHSGKALASILENYPRDELLQIEAGELYAHAMAILQLGERQRIRLLLRRDAYGRFVSCLVFVPRDKYNTELRQRFQKILLGALSGVSSEFTVSLSESALARILIVVRVRQGAAAPALDARALEAKLAAAARRWEDELHESLVERVGEERANRLFATYGAAFPAGYREDTPVRSALVDLETIDALGEAQPLGMNLYRPLDAEPGTLRFKLYRRGAPIALSDSLPMLENLGVRVLDERPYEIEPADGTRLWITDFGLALAADAEPAMERVRPLFHDAFEAMWSGRIESDGLNRLVLGAELSAREVAILRAYSRYLRQAAFTFSQSYIQQTLVAHPDVARMLVELFAARFDPAKASKEAEEALAEGIGQRLDEVPSLDEDRTLRRLLALVQATLRTNCFQPGSDGKPKPYIAFKLDPRRIPELPEPRPMFEIFVYSPRVEGVHLRGGRVARGGIRWSDRMEDFRTEVLGLMKAQMVKNVVIVPVGSKGGFVVKRPPAGGDREALAREGVECYRTFLRGLLDLTDNLVGGRSVPPPSVVRHDGDDPYLVVAADKGTATFSDIANGIAKEYGFWLGDAFASGGSAGYDHKKMGITARGAWESVKRHFRELGVDTQTADFTVAGIGDMSGDVFGNGMLLSRHIRLVAAFDHRHVFIDPDPDPERSFAERERLFGLPRSSWADYDAKLISRGGGVWPRSAKSIALSPEARRALGLEAPSLTPSELVSAILRAPVDLLYNGGIGTYVKSSRETHAQVGDRANDAVRVNGKDLRCRVVAEGGNLGFTQLGRIEYALAGGRINTDAIDNSAGVDCSDHEVNIKILLDAVVREGELTVKQRNQLLAEMTDEVAALVLRDNTFQTQSLSVAGAVAPALLDQQARFIRALERSGRLNRALEFLPSEEEIAERRSAKLGLTAPERAVLLAYAKIALYDELLASDIPEEPTIATALERYFPRPLRARCRRQIPEHPLRREIVATHVTNSMVNRVGSTFVHRMREDTGASAGEVVRAYVVTREAFGLVPFWESVEALDHKVPDRVQTGMLIEQGRLLARATLWFLRRRALLADVAAAIGRFRPGIEALARLLPDSLSGSEQRGYREIEERLAAEGVPAALAARVAGFDAQFAALDIAEVAGALGCDVARVARLYFALGGGLEFPWLRSRIATLAADSHWKALAKAALRDDLAGLQRQLAADALEGSPGEGDPARLVEAWEAANRALVERFRQVLADLRAAESPDLAMLSVAMRELRNLAGRA
jgi:glutamate dehydrogenase